MNSFDSNSTREPAQGSLGQSRPATCDDLQPHWLLRGFDLCMRRRLRNFHLRYKALKNLLVTFECISVERKQLVFNEKKVFF